MKKKWKAFFKISFWRGFRKYVVGICQMANDKYTDAIKNFNWIIENKNFEDTEYLVYKNIGICYAHLESFPQAEANLLKTLEYEGSKKNGELHQWLGYIYCVKEEPEKALEHFRQAFNIGQRGIDRWLVNQQYVRDHIVILDKIMRENKDIFPDWEKYRE